MVPICLEASLIHYEVELSLHFMELCVCFLKLSTNTHFEMLEV
jgi:hypothetical protein